MRDCIIESIFGVELSLTNGWLPDDEMTIGLRRWRTLNDVDDGRIQMGKRTLTLLALMADHCSKSWESLSRPPWWKWRILKTLWLLSQRLRQVTLYLESIDASTICPHVFSGSEKKTRMERIFPARRNRSCWGMEWEIDAIHQKEKWIRRQGFCFVYTTGKCAFVRRGSTKFTTSQEFL